MIKIDKITKMVKYIEENFLDSSLRSHHTDSNLYQFTINETGNLRNRTNLLQLH